MESMRGASVAGLAAPDAAPLTDECPGDGRGILDGAHGTTSVALCAEALSVRKPWLRLQAECLLAGLTADLIDGDDGRPMLVVSRWALTRSFTSVAEAQAWLARFASKVTA